MKVYVCASKHYSSDKSINAYAKKLGEILGKNPNITYVQNGTTTGLCGLILSEYLKYSKDVQFYIADAYELSSIKDMLSEENFHCEVYKSEAERLNQIASCDMVLVLPGELDTLLEFLYCNVTKSSREHNPKIGFININGFFDGFLQQISTIEKLIKSPDKVPYHVFDKSEFAKLISEENITKNKPNI